jgi:hypothetical protein
MSGQEVFIYFLPSSTLSFLFSVRFPTRVPNSHREGERNLVGGSYRVFKYVPFQRLKTPRVVIDQSLIGSYAV